jgi:hypothetical protein
MKFLLKKKSAWIPLVMSLTALLLVIGNVAVFGVVKSGDEGTAAHIFQLLLACQLPFVIYFAIKWLPKKPTQAILILLLQAISGLIALAPVFLLGL